MHDSVDEQIFYKKKKLKKILEKKLFMQVVFKP